MKVKVNAEMIIEQPTLHDVKRFLNSLELERHEEIVELTFDPAYEVLEE